MAQVNPGAVRGKQTYTNDGGGYSSQASAQSAKTPSQEYYNKTNTMIQNYRNSLNNTGGTRSVATDTGGGGGGGGGGGTSDDIVNMIKNLLNEQKQKADEYYKTLYEQQISQIGQQDEANRNQANLNYMRGNRYLNSLYGNGISGQGLSNRVRNNSNWQNNLASIRQNTANNKASALAQYNSGLANNASTLAQGWYNYVLPVYTNRQQWLDNLAYRNM